MKISVEDVKPAIMRLKRARGQLDAVIAGLENENECHDVITQLAAVSKAIDRAGYLVIATGMKQCYSGGIDIDSEHLEKMFLSLA
ncbi:metal-sensitive transcriptional regulator [Arcanobacterium haemolyticum]|uniref:metal-sensitive transcriptional regulator n=1 Tax=Arcanobacterium haemolyticum TaxID=28264 RepID=UPI000DA0BC22|nr:metal-sensitive transcriptional regulator [Arcanobacterium haemolyticum]SPT74842.1 Copper-sensitive operon repressor [Arcanobacterium haemolyticum]